MSTPRLHFRLPGTWHRVDLRGGPQSEASIRSVVRDVIGSADDRAHVRADLRRDLHQAVRAAQEAEARSMMFSTEIAPGSPLPVTLVVYAPTRLRMSPTLGTEPAHVLAVLSESLRQPSSELNDISGSSGSAADVTWAVALVMDSLCRARSSAQSRGPVHRYWAARLSRDSSGGPTERRT